MMSAVGQRGHVSQHRHLLPSRVTVIMNVDLIVSLVVGLGVRLAGKSGAMSLNYTAASTDMKFHVVYLLWVPQLVNFWPPFYIVINQLLLFFCL